MITAKNHINTANKIFEHLLTLDKKEKLVIAYGGESGSGKTQGALDLFAKFKEEGFSVSIIHMDDYFFLPAADNHQNRLKNIDNVGPQEVNLELLENHIQLFYENKDVIGPKSNFHENKMETQKLSFFDKSILIIEGTYTLLLNKVDLKIFIDRTYKDTLENRIKRGREVFDEFVEKVLDIEHEIVSKTKSKAHVLIENDYQVNITLNEDEIQA